MTPFQKYLLFFTAAICSLGVLRVFFSDWIFFEFLFFGIVIAAGIVGYWIKCPDCDTPVSYGGEVLSINNAATSF
ncbi:hypothetical protein [Undibacterium flavidum]|uniref:Uncharacterized protein n=1 Tax=Undibacterium flavidum TaxID=2762297 RepID=A0ABR6Y9X6_9BURK|nr:hypothetical protein [Undibacterium flavidum]MBC3873366.1 hypothetical protein [Undibacterium flavidum]